MTGLTAAAGLIGLAVFGQASAACMDNLLRQGPPTKSSSSAGRFVPSVYQPDEMRGASWLQVGDSGYESNSIVGLWQFQFAGFAVDWGTQAWHSDGTELLFSGGQNPETGDVCQGVWRKIGRNTCTLNHIAMGWNAPGGEFGTRFHFHIKVRLDPSGNSYSGWYKVTGYTVTPANPFDESAPFASGTGTVTATRVMPD